MYGLSSSMATECILGIVAYGCRSGYYVRECGSAYVSLLNIAYRSL